MNTILFTLLAFIAGAAIAAQASMNAQLAIIVENHLFSVLVAFSSGLLVLGAYYFLSGHALPANPSIKAVPFYLWFTGGLLSAFALSSFYWLIPKVGVAAMISAALTGQLAFSMLAGHFGWFSLPVTSFTAYKLLGSMSLVMGIILINI